MKHALPIDDAPHLLTLRSITPGLMRQIRSVIIGAPARQVCIIDEVALSLSSAPGIAYV